MNLGKHKDRRTGEEWEALGADAAFQLGISSSYCSAFERDEPMSRDLYEISRHHTTFGYGGAPPYEEYLRLYDMYSETCRLRASGWSEGSAANEVLRRINPDKDRYLAPPDLW